MMLPADAPAHFCLQPLQPLPSVQLGFVEELNISDKRRGALEELWLAFQDVLDQCLLIAAPGDVFTAGIVQAQRLVACGFAIRDSESTLKGFLLSVRRGWFCCVQIL